MASARDPGSTVLNSLTFLRHFSEDTQAVHSSTENTLVQELCLCVCVCVFGWGGLLGAVGVTDASGKGGRAPICPYLRSVILHQTVSYSHTQRQRMDPLRGDTSPGFDTPTSDKRQIV